MQQLAKQHDNAIPAQQDSTEHKLKLQHLPFLNMAEVARLIGVSLGTIQTEVRSGRLEVLRLGTRGRRIIVSKAALQRWEVKHLQAWGSHHAA
jgi:excisionase family DNA binding protein